MFEGGFFVIQGLLTMIIGPLIVRVYCELLIIFFKINDSLNDLNKKVDNLSAHHRIRIMIHSIKYHAMSDIN